MPQRLAITAPHVVEVISYQEAKLDAHQVRVRTEIASGKHGTTRAMFDAENFRDQRFDQEMRLFVAEAESGGSQDLAPRNTGTTGVGMVTEVGSAVSRWQIGDRVFGLMDVRESNVCHEERIWDLGQLDPLLALCVEPAYVAFHCIRESNVRFGETVAIFGLGALGLLAMRMAVQGGAERVFGVDMLPARREWAMQHGADYVFDPREEDAPLRIHELTAGKGVDVAIELAGVYGALQSAIRSVRIGGTVCAAGFYQGEAHGLWLGREFHHNRLTLVVPHGCGWGTQPRDYPRWDEARAYDAIISMMRQGKLTAPGLIKPVVSLQEGPRVFRQIENDAESVIKFAVRFEE